MSDDSWGELQDLDEEIQKTLGAPGISPEILVEFGQRIGGSSATEALSRLLNEGHCDLPQMVQVEEYRGPILEPGALEELFAEQELVLPTHRVTPAPPRVTGDFWWFPLESLDTHPLRDKFRSIGGRRLSFLPKPQKLELTSFLRLLQVRTKEVPEWVDLLVFTSEPFDGPMWSTRDPKPREGGHPAQALRRPSQPVKRIEVPDAPMQMVSVVIVACKLEPEGSPEIPDWLAEHCGPAPYGTSKMGVDCTPPW